MAVTLPLAGFRSSRPAARVEHVLAIGRAFLAVTGLLAIYLDPTEPTRFREETYAVLVGYAVYSLIVLVYVNVSTRLTVTHGQVLHGLDIVWTSVLTFLSEGPVSPFFLFFLFVVLAAAYRWGFRETVGTAGVIVIIFLVETLVAAVGPWRATWFATIEVELNRYILRLAYLLLTGVLLGYLAEQEKRSGAELAALAAAASQATVNLGLGGSMTAVARVLKSTFSAASVSVVVRDHETGRTLLWHVDDSHPDAQRSAVQRLELTRQQQATWLFPDCGGVWHAVTDSNGGDSTHVRVTEPNAWRLKRVPLQLPATFVTNRPFRTVTAVNMGLSNEWHGRAYLFDAQERGGLERRLHFLEALAEHVTPPVTNVFLLRRLRARAGAAERARVARELHDGAIQSLFGIDMKIEAMRRERNRTPAEIESDLTDIQHLLRQEVLALRELMQALRPMELDSGEQLPEVIAGLVERFRRDTGISARFIATGNPIPLTPATALEIVRIVQEALVNVRKHSQARNVLVRLTAEAGTCSLVVEDDGRGFDFEGRLSARELDERGAGPAIIKERARMAAADLAVDSTPGTGARVELVFRQEAHA